MRGTQWMAIILAASAVTLSAGVRYLDSTSRNAATSAASAGDPDRAVARDDAAAAADIGEEREGPPDEWLLAQRLYGSRLSVALLARATDQALSLRAAAETRANGAQATWSFLGPTNIGGRLLDIAIDPNNADTVYVGSASGGVWKTTDGGATLSSVWPADHAPAVGALAITSDGRLYAGTGEAGPGGGSITFGNKGVYLSRDGGATWSPLGLAQSERISRIAIDPSNERRIFVAAAGPLFAPGGQRGIYRSTNGGRNWTRVLAGANATTGASDVLIDPVNPQRVYAAMWDHMREPARRRYGGVGSGLLRSTDGGTTWMLLGPANGLPAPDRNVGRVSIGLSPSNPMRLYALYIDAVGYFTAFYTSTDGGDSWTQLPNNSQLSGSQSSYGWWFARIWVDPANDRHVFVPGVPLMESTTAGQSWSQTSSVHADQHAMMWDPAKPGRVYLGNDGGLYRSDTNGSNPWTPATVQPYTQLYTVDVSEQDPSRMVGGAQDNFCLRSYTSNNPHLWNSYGNCGDGLETLVNYDNQNIVYGCSQYGSCSRSTNGGDSSSSIGATVSQRRNWKSPILFDPNDPSIMYYAGNIVNRSVNGGVSWTAISDDLTGGDPFPGPGEPYPFGTLTTLVAGGDGNTLYAGTDDARVWFTHDLGGLWTRASDPDLPDRWVSDVAVDPQNANVAYVTFTGFYEGDDTPYVLRTNDGGVSWTNITGNLPQAPVNTIAQSRGRLLVGSEVGVFMSTDGGATWLALGTGLPMVPVMDLRVHEPTGTLYAATFGRGMWKTALP